MFLFTFTLIHLAKKVYPKKHTNDEHLTFLPVRDLLRNIL